MARSRKGASQASSRRGNRGSGETQPKKSEAESPVEFKYETEDGATITLSPDAIEAAQKFEIDESSFIEISAEIDISPVDLKVEKSPLDLSVSGEVSVPGDIIGVGGAVTIDLGSGEITGGSVDVELGGASVEISVNDKGCEVAIKVSYLGIGISYGRDICNDEEDEEEPPPPPSPDPVPKNENGDVNPFPPHAPLPRKYAFFVAFQEVKSSRTPIGNHIIIGSPLSGHHSSRWFISPFFDFANKGWYSEYFLERDSYVYNTSDGNTVTVPGDSTKRNIYFSEKIILRQNRHPTYTDLYYSSTGFYTIIGMGWLNEVAEFMSAISTHFCREADWGQDLICTATRYSVVWTYPVDKEVRKKILPPSFPPIRENTMKDKCCDETLELLRDIHKYLGIDKLKKNKGFILPNSMMTPGGKGTTKLPTYVDINSALFKAIDAKGFNGPMVAFVKDANKAKKGDQSVELQFNSLDAALKNVLELLIELKGDSANRLNLQIRLAYMVTRMYRTITKLYYICRAILDGVGTPLKSFTITLPFEFNLFAGKSFGKGFGGGKGSNEPTNPKLDLNDEDTTEALLEQLLDTVELEITVDEVEGKHPDLREILLRKGNL